MGSSQTAANRDAPSEQENFERMLADNTASNAARSTRDANETAAPAT